MKSADQRAFEHFKNGAGFWSSEDGMLMALVIQRRPDWAEVVQREHAHVFNERKPFDAARMKPKFVCRHWVGSEWFDGSCGQKRGKVWTVTEEQTEFPVYEYDLVPNDTQPTQQNNEQKD